MLCASQRGRAGPLNGASGICYKYPYIMAGRTEKHPPTSLVDRTRWNLGVRPHRSLDGNEVPTFKHSPQEGDRTKRNVGVRPHRSLDGNDVPTFRLLLWLNARDTVQGSLAHDARSEMRRHEALNTHPMHNAGVLVQCPARSPTPMHMSGIPLAEAHYTLH